MKLSSPSPQDAGFSLVELMTVIGIMILLAGILIASLPGIQTRVNRNQVEAFIAEIESGLSKYQIDHGIYPQNPGGGGDRDTAGIEGASVLYKHLSGDWDENGTADIQENEDSDEKVYVAKLSYKENENSKNPRSDVIGGEFMVIDTYGNPIRYLAEPPNIKPEERTTINPTYDLWSIVDADPGVEEDQAKHITNWQSN